MTASKGIFTGTGYLIAGAMLAMFAMAPSAIANPVRINFNGAGGSGYADLTVGTDTTPGDPTGAQLVTGANGVFSDTNIGIDNVSITGVVARNFATPDDMKLGGAWKPGDLPFPASFSELAVSNPPPNDTAITFDDLFYAAGSPQTCWDYPFGGGLLDPYGVMFTLSDGGFLDLWSDGVTSPGFFGPSWPGGLTYGFGVINADDAVTDFQFLGVRAAVPEPKFLWLFGAGVLGLFAWRRSLEMKPATKRS